MSDVDQRHVLPDAGTAGGAATRPRWLLQALLVCGIAASVMYLSMMWLIRYPGYDALSQTVSELSAWDVSTRSLWIVLGSVYDALMVAFGIGVWANAGGAARLRVVGGLLVGFGLLGVVWPFAAMHQREVLAAGGGTLADTGHLILGGATVALMFASMAIGAAALGSRFRVYTLATIVILLAFGFLTTLDAPRVADDLSTPWAGLWERINISAFLLWIGVLAVILLRRLNAEHGATGSIQREPGTSPATR